MVPIYVFADGSAAREVLNAVATFMSLEDYKTALSIAFTISVMMAGIRYLITHDLRGMFMWIFTYTMITSVMMIPYSGTVQIIDASNPGAEYTVDHVPLGVVVPATLITSITWALVQDFDSIYSVPGELDFSQTGMMFGSRLFKASLQATVTNSQDKAFMAEFFENCIMQDVAIGKYPMSDITENTNLLGSLTGSGSTALTMSPLRGVYYPPENGTFMTCAAAAGQVAKVVQNASQVESNSLATLMYGNNPTHGDINGNINNVYTYYFNNQAVASQNILQQNILVNAFKQAASAVATSNEATAGAINYSYTNAEENQAVSGLTLANMAADMIPMMHTIFMLLLMGMFPIIVLLAIQPTLFVQVTKNYIYAYIYLASWPFLFDFLNFLMNYYLSLNTVYTSSTGVQLVGATISTTNALFNLNTQAAAYCGYLMMAVPFLPPLLVKGMSSGLSMLSSRMNAGMESSVSSFASQAESGNMSMGDTSFGNQSFNNVSGNKWDTNTLRASGSTTVQTPYGGTVTMTESGNSVVNASGAMNTMPFAVDMQTAMSSSLSSSMTKTQQAIQDASSSLQKSVSMAASDIVQLGQMSGTTTTTGSGSSITDSSELAQSYSKAMDVAESYKKDHSLSASDKQILQSMVEGGLQAGVGLPEAAKAVSPVSASASINASGQSMSIREVASGSSAYHDLSANQRQAIDDLVRASQQYSSTQHSDLSNTSGSTLTKDIQNNLSNVTQQSETISSSLQKLSSYQQEAQVVNSSSFSSNQGAIYNTMFKDYLEQQDPTLAPVLLNNPNLSEVQREKLDIYLQSFANQVVSSGQFTDAKASVANAPAMVESAYNSSAGSINQSAGSIGGSFERQSAQTAGSYSGGSVPSAASVNSQVSSQTADAKAQIDTQASALQQSSSQIATDVNARFTKGDKVATEGAFEGAAKSFGALLPGEKDAMQDKELNFNDPKQNLNKK